MRNCIRAAAAVGVIAVGGHVLASSTPPHASQKTPITKAKGQQLLAKAAENFTENKGQWNKDGLFVSRSKSVDVWVTKEGATFDFHRQKANKRTGQVVRMNFVGNKGSLAANGHIADKGKFGFAKGKISVQANRYAEVMQQSPYKGIGVRYYTDQERPRFDMVLAPHADARQIGLKFSGAKSVKVQADKIVLDTQIGPVEETKLYAYQTDGRGKHRVDAKFAQRKDGSVGIDLGPYDASRQLVIDPLVYGTYYGGEGGWDDVRSIVADANGGIYMVGYTQSLKFPAIEGPYGFNLNGPQDGFVAKLQGNAYSNIYAAYVGGTLSDSVNFAALDQFGNLWTAGITQSSDFPANNRSNVEYLRLAQDSIGDVSPAPDGGTFLLTYNGFATGELAWNDSDADIAAQLETLPGLTLNTLSNGNPDITGSLPDTVRIALGNSSPSSLQAISTYIGDAKQNPNIGEVNEGLEPRYRINIDSGAGGDFIEKRGSTAHGGSFAITFVNPDSTGALVTATTKPIPWNASAAQVKAALTALSNNNGGIWQTAGGPLPPPPFPFDQELLIGFQVSSTAPILPVPVTRLFIRYSDIALTPVPTYEIHVPGTIFVQQWIATPDGLLNPTPTQALLFGGDKDMTISGFAVQQQPKPIAGSPVVFGFAGNTDTALPENTKDKVTGAYIARYKYLPSTQTFTKVSVKYLGEQLPLLIGGFAMDLDGNGYVAGQIESTINDDFPSNDGLFTTVGGWGDNKLRLRDIFVRKYSPDNSKLIYSGILGGNDDDWIGGFDFDADGTVENTGSAIAVDNQNCVYVTGVTSSFNFPRTLGVLGPTFVSQPNITMFATKISADGTALKYSTSLNTNTLLLFGNQINPHRIGIGIGGEWIPSPVMPAGIAVDALGDAFISGNGHPQWVSFPDPPGMPGDPNEPTGYQLPTIPLVGAVTPGYTTVATPDYPASGSFLSVLDPQAQTFLFSSFLSGVAGDGGLSLGEQVFAPYVDQFGDCWVMGNIVTGRGFSRVSADGNTVHVYVDAQGLPRELITPLAFKAIGDQTGGNSLTMIYGAYQHQLSFWGYQSAPALVNTGYAKDGIVLKFRVGTPAVQSLTFTPGTVPGGSGASALGTVTLSGPAPAGGAQVQIALGNTTAASLSATSAVSNETLTIPAGATTITFTVFTNAVTTSTPEQVQATYLGSFQIAQLNIVPWLQGVGVSPNTVVGGNTTSGQITLAAVAPAAGVQITLTTDHPTLISFPGGNTVVVPGGQSTATFPIQTNGVATRTFAKVTASNGGVNFSAQVTLTTANVASVSFVPPIIPGLGTTVGTVTLNGQAGSTLTLNLTGLPATYTFPATVKILKGATSASFNVTTPDETSQVVRTVTATLPPSGGANGYLGGSASGSFTVSVATTKGLTITPNPVTGGSSAVGELDLTAQAPTGGVVVNLSADSRYVKFTGGVTNISTNTTTNKTTATLTVPAGATLADFTIQTFVNAGDVVTNVVAARGPSDSQTAKLTILGATIGLTVDPSDVVGGFKNSTGTLTLSSPAGSAGLTVQLKSSNPGAASVPATVFIPSGHATATFPITTTAVKDNVSVTITATLGGNSSTAQLTVESPGVFGVKFSAASVRGGQPVTVVITLDAPAPTGGLLVSLAVTNSEFNIVPASVTIAAGKSSTSFTLTTKRVSRNQSTTLTATSANGSSAAASLLVTLGF